LRPSFSASTVSGSALFQTNGRNASITSKGRPLLVVQPSSTCAIDARLLKRPLSSASLPVDFWRKAALWKLILPGPVLPVGIALQAEESPRHVIEPTTPSIK
jgi:hypothetical protein